MVMAYALFPGDKYFHLTRASSIRTFCGLPTKRPTKGGDEYRPPARVMVDYPPPALEGFGTPS